MLGKFIPTLPFSTRLWYLDFNDSLILSRSTMILIWLTYSSDLFQGIVSYFIFPKDVCWEFIWKRDFGIKTCNLLSLSSWTFLPDCCPFMLKQTSLMSSFCWCTVLSEWRTGSNVCKIAFTYVNVSISSKEAFFVPWWMNEVSFFPCNSLMPFTILCFYWQHGSMMKLYEHDSCGCASEPCNINLETVSLGSVYLYLYVVWISSPLGSHHMLISASWFQVVPVSVLIFYCNSTCMRTMSLKNEKVVQYEYNQLDHFRLLPRGGKSSHDTPRKIYRSEDIGFVLVGSLKVSKMPCFFSSQM